MLANNVKLVNNCSIQVALTHPDDEIYEVYITLTKDNRPRRAGVYYKQKSMFVTSRNNEHLFRKTNAWGINANMLEMLEGLTIIHLVNEDTREHFEVGYETFKNKSREFSFDGYDTQKFLPLIYWARSK